MAEVEQALKDLSEKYRAGLAQLQEQVESSQRPNSKQQTAVRQQQVMLRKEQWLIDKAMELAGGNPAAITEIETVLRNRATHAHTRMLAILLLAMIDSVRSMEILMACIVDKSDSDTVRFFCAMQLGNSRNAVAPQLMLEAINDPTTDEEFDENAKLRTNMINAGMSLNLRVALIWHLLDSPGGAAKLASRTNKPLSFQNGWLHSIIALWQKTGSENHIAHAAAVLKNRANPEKLRVGAGMALYIMRRESKGQSTFPKVAWDALRAVWVERDYGELHRTVGEVLKLQGA